MTKSITDLTEKEQQRNKEAYRNYVDYWEDVLGSQAYSPIMKSGEPATSLEDFRDNFKDDVKEVNTGFECGVGCDKFSSWIDGDIIEAFKFVTKKRTLTQ